MRKPKERKPKERLLDGSERIYCVVAETVQVPRQSGAVVFHAQGQINVVQPAGRLAAQAAHAVSLCRLEMVKRFLDDNGQGENKDGRQLTVKPSPFSVLYEPFTTIVLGARDSAELLHVANLLHYFEVPVHAFYDTEQPDYGSLDAKVMTAIATEPVEAAVVHGILDYLPLWSPKARD